MLCKCIIFQIISNCFEYAHLSQEIYSRDGKYRVSQSIGVV
nr:MAG TPA: hypothetical protein [Caudoviricetes sp.]